MKKIKAFFSSILKSEKVKYHFKSFLQTFATGFVFTAATLIQTLPPEQILDKSALVGIAVAALRAGIKGVWSLVALMVSPKEL